jgi:L-rhamnose mutarotase
LLLYYAVNAHKDYKFFKSYMEISIETGLDERTVRKYNEDWVKLGIISVTEPVWGSGKATDYHMHLKKLQEIVKLCESRKDVARDTKRLQGRERTAKWRRKAAEALKQADTTELVTA